MTLPVPNLDDRRFQDLVDDSKRFVQRRCPEWSDHNVSDPGVTLIETFAMVADQVLYRLNRVPDRLYVRFLELLGLQLVPPTPARTDVTFWLAAPRRDSVVVRAGTEVATERTGADGPVVFETVEELDIVACSLAAAASASPAAEVVDRTEQLADEGAFPCFGSPPRVGDALLVGLSVAVPRCVVTIRVDCRAEGAGVDPRNPPLVWEAWTGRRWVACELDPGADGTGGLNRPGDVVLHLPADHTESVIAGHRAGWLRCRLVAPAERQPFYQQSPRILGASAFTVGGTIPAAHAETVREEIVGTSEGVPGQRFPLSRGPVLGADGPLVVEVASGDGGWSAWERVDSFDGSTREDRHFRLDTTTGELVFGPGVRQRDGSVRLYGAVPAKSAPVAGHGLPRGRGEPGQRRGRGDHRAAHLGAVRDARAEPQARHRGRRRGDGRGGEAPGARVPAHPAAGRHDRRLRVPGPRRRPARGAHPVPRGGGGGGGRDPARGRARDRRRPRPGGGAGGVPARPGAVGPGGGLPRRAPDARYPTDRRTALLPADQRGGAGATRSAGRRRARA